MNSKSRFEEERRAKERRAKGRRAKGRRRKPRLPPLPKTWRGAQVLRGQGMNGDALEDFLDRKSCDEFDPTREQWLVIEDQALLDRGSTEVRVFSKKLDAIRCARALSNGNINHRVIGLGEQILVVATENSL